MRFFTAMGKLMLGHAVAGGAARRDDSLARVAVDGRELRAVMNQTSASALTPSVVVEMGGKFMCPPPALGAHQTSFAIGVLPGCMSIETIISLLVGVPAGQSAGPSADVDGRVEPRGGRVDRRRRVHGLARVPATTKSRSAPPGVG